MTRRCWARAVSDCSDDISSEHIVSKALFPDNVTIRGPSWAKEFKTVGANAVTANILCRRHNSAVSALDAVAKDAWTVFRKLFEHLEDVRLARVITHTTLPRRKYRVDGAGLERWCFKTTINLAASGNVLGFPRDWQPRKELAEYVFGRGKLPEGCGLGVVLALGERMHDRDTVIVKPLTTDQSDVEGFLIRFRGLRLAGSSTQPLNSLYKPGADFDLDRVDVHPKKMIFTDVCQVAFRWV